MLEDVLILDILSIVLVDSDDVEQLFCCGRCQPSLAGELMTSLFWLRCLDFFSFKMLNLGTTIWRRNI